MERKIALISKKSEKNAFEKSFKNKAYANQPLSAQPNGRQTFWAPHGPSNYPSND
jgi:hypothetical protein